MDGHSELARLKRWLVEGDMGQRAAAADGLASRYPQESIELLVAQLRRETDEWVFVCILCCLADAAGPDAAGAVAEVGESLVDPYLRFVFLNWAISWDDRLPPYPLARYIEEGPWFVRLSAAALLKKVSDVDVSGLVLSVIDDIEARGLRGIKPGISTCDADRLLYDESFALAFARDLLAK
jgi:hypothetical protein